MITGNKRKTLIEKIFGEKEEVVKEDKQEQKEGEKANITKLAEDKAEKEEKKNKALIWLSIIGIFVVFTSI